MKASALALLASLTLTGAPALAQDKVTTEAGTIDAAKTQRFFKRESYSPHAGRNFPDRPLGDDQDLHSS